MQSWVNFNTFSPTFRFYRFTYAVRSGERRSGSATEADSAPQGKNALQLQRNTWNSFFIREHLERYVCMGRISKKRKV